MVAGTRATSGAHRLPVGARDAPSGLTVEEPVTWRHCAELAVVIVVAVALALTLPLATTVFALLLFGVLHNYFELRYVIGRFGWLFTGRLVEAVLISLTAIVLLRLLPLGALGRPLEIAAGYLMLLVVLVLRLWNRPMLLTLGSAALVAATALSLAHADYHFVLIAHLHNLLPVVFLWEWSVSRSWTLPAQAFRTLHLGWALAVPAAILAGAFGQPAILDSSPASTIVGDAEAFVAALAPPGADSEIGGRFLAVFAMLQLMHYYVWCRFFPMVGVVEAARFDRAVAGLGLLHGRRLTALVAVFAAATMVLLWTDFRLGRTLYGAVAGYHAYLEYALLLLVLVAWRQR
jgi:hypothetical protein